MRVLIVSDTHGHDRNLEIALEKVKPDFLVHCGDVEEQEDYIREIAGCPVRIVSGNNDFFSDLNREEEFELGAYHVLLTHGHNYGVAMGPEMLMEEARARGAQIVMFGHTHKPMVNTVDGVTAVNPGSLSYPRQNGRKPSYIVMDIDKDGLAHYTIKYMESDNR